MAIHHDDAESIKPSIRRPNCGSCWFFQAYSTPDRGQCRVNPPAVLPPNFIEAEPDLQRLVMWPMVSISDWCGSFKKAGV